MKLLNLLLILVVCGTGCTLDAEKEHNPILPQNWFKAEIARLKSGTPICLEKEVAMNNKRDTVKLDAPNWEKELEVFSGIELKPLALEQQFDKKDSADWLVFTANDPKQTVRRMAIFSANGKVEKWNVHIVSKDKIRSGNRKLTYTVGEGYEILGNQEIKLYGMEEFHIVGRFVDCSHP